MLTPSKKERLKVKEEIKEMRALFHQFLEGKISSADQLKIETDKIMSVQPGLFEGGREKS